MLKRLILSVCLTLALPLVAQAQSGALITQLRQELAAEQDELTSGYSLGAARMQLAREFDAADVEFSARFVDRWSIGIADRWAGYETFFTEHLDRLDAWQAAIDTSQVTAEEAEAQLRPGLARTAIVAAAMQDWLGQEIDAVTDRAIWTDLAHDIGCCEPLYYHALSEADTAALDGHSPDPAQVAALILIPSVNDAGDTEPVTTRDAAFADLVMRADALAIEPGDDLAAHAALLSEAALLLALFPEARGETERLDEILDIAARVGFTARPVAPLLSLATITEPGPTRDFLLAEAEDRLTARADHLRALENAQERRMQPRNTASTSQNVQMLGNSATATISDFTGSGLLSVIPNPSPQPALPPVASSTTPTSSDEEMAEIAIEAAIAQISETPEELSDILRNAERADALLEPQDALESLIGRGF